jgi:hypothetical protein
MNIDTKTTLYICTDALNGEVHILTPKHKTFQSMENLRLDDPDPYGPNGTDPAIFKLLCESNDMTQETFDL